MIRKTYDDNPNPSTKRKLTWTKPISSMPAILALFHDAVVRMASY